MSADFDLVNRRQVQRATRLMPGPSVERTCPGKRGHAYHLKRWASAIP